VKEETPLVIVGEKWEERVVLLQALLKMIPPAFTFNFRVCSEVESFGGEGKEDKFVYL